MKLLIGKLVRLNGGLQSYFLLFHPRFFTLSTGDGCGQHRRSAEECENGGNVVMLKVRAVSADGPGATVFLLSHLRYLRESINVVISPVATLAQIEIPLIVFGNRWVTI